MDNPFQKHFFRREQRKTFRQIKTHHPSEHTFLRNAGIEFVFFMAVFHDVFEEVKVLVFGMFFGGIFCHGAILHLPTVLVIFRMYDARNQDRKRRIMNFPFWYTYIVTDDTDSVFYTGVVSTLEKRWYEHGVLNPDLPLAKLPKFLPYDYKFSKLVWFAGFTRYAQAKAFEQKLKRWHRQ